MATPVVERMKQVRLGLGSALCESVTKNTTELAVFTQEHEAHEEILLAKCPPTLWPHGSYRASCPRPILISESHCRQLKDLHGALTAAMNDIVSRWWRDKAANFPARMPLEEEEEQLLQWLDEQEELGNLPKFSTRQGSWRPDFLVEEVHHEDGSKTENFRLSEINARFCFNGFMHILYGNLALQGMNLNECGLSIPANGAEFFDSLLDMFRHDQPLHLLKGEEDGIDIGMFIQAVHDRIGTEPRLITPTDLRLVADETTGRTRLCCLATRGASSDGDAFRTAEGEAVEEIHQVGLELHQHELAALGGEMRRQLGLRCFNDLRTVLLVHDKRMLGIIGQELCSLVARGVLTPAQAVILDRGVAQTILPGSPELLRLAAGGNCDDTTKDGYLLKPVRCGKGAGIVFGEDMTAEAWRSTLNGLRSTASPDSGSMVVQRRIKQQLYDVVLKRNDGNGMGEMKRNHLVGTYHVINGRYLGIGIWRSSAERICAISTGGSWMCSVIRS
ncbi:hypothetical protein ISF_05661 [Cordyceps fumosorosea ARSEF 2679]|uniref:Taurine catabolism dioxygenase TauD n=1 Tax=Cordyceps fumosorosea (strain ARSEF 2679) TaxID=1081104 RepID=A0A167TI64_CORFA|nr:hypothetical protein ISF_05661 [Cordyceps fumosorosea ARSEF 2679]OAA60622.1 hypothetical protein ISF_05661 [Cordyceps fumosorosea ARSEF 2679]